jgi:hypothetical protein
MTLPSGWQNHLLATYAATEEAIERIKRIAVHGRSPANHLLTPLPEEDWSVIEAGLTHIGEQFADLMRHMAPDQLRNARETQPFAATRYHLSLALMSLDQEVLEEIDPDQPPRRGELASEDKEQIRFALVTMRAEIAALRTFVDRLSESKPRPTKEKT